MGNITPIAVLALLCLASPVRADDVVWADEESFMICLSTEDACVPACRGLLCLPDPAPWLWRKWDEECRRYVCGPLEPVPPPVVDGVVCFWGVEWVQTTTDAMLAERCSAGPTAPAP